MRHRKRGYALIDVLVSLAIIVVLIALLLPAVQTAREVARRAACALRLKQLGLATHAYAADFGVLPAGDSGTFSHLVRLLPYLEHESVYALINFPSRARSGNNVTARSVWIGAFVCPATPSSSTFTEDVGRTSYAGNMGSGRWLRRADGVFTTDTLHWKDITDGLSHTAAMAEWVFVPDAHSGSLRGLVFEVPSAIPDRETFRTVCFAMSVDPQRASDILGSEWLGGWPGWTQYNHQLTPNERSCMAQRFPLTWAAYTASSYHSGGLHVLYADGRVWWMTESVDSQVWQSIGSRNGEEVLR